MKYLVNYFPWNNYTFLIFILLSFFMAKVVEKPKIVKLQINAGKANPAPPIGTVLGPTGVNMQEFCSQFNEKTKDKIGMIIPVVISIFKNRSFTFILKSPPASFLIKDILKLKSGSAKPHVDKVASITVNQLKEIAKIKMDDLSANCIDSAVKIIAGTARSMGVTVL
jgi:large subunit ribosomal protein L11